MIKDNKKLNPFIGIAIGVFLIFFGIFGTHFLFGDILSEDLFIAIITPFISVGTFFLAFNAGYLGLKIMARKMDESASMMNSITFLHSICVVTKVKKASDLYIIKYSDNYLHVLTMNERTTASVSWLRKLFGPKLPTNFPLKCPVITEFNGFKIRKCNGKAVLYDIDENQWISGQATMFSIFLIRKPISLLLYPDILRDLINLIETI